MFGFKKKQAAPSVSSSNPPKTKNLVAQSADTLLSPDHRKTLITKMRRTSSVTDKVFQDHYMYAIRKAAEFAQSFPASANHHHSNEGGLLDHMLEVAYNATRVCRGFIMPPNAQPEDITKHEEKWRYAAFLAALSHDLGKLIADIDTVYRQAKSKEHNYVNWHAWYGPLPEGAEYIYRFKPKNGTSYKGLHEQLSATILPNLITPSASSWIRSDPTLMSQLMATVTQAAHFSGVIGEIVKKSDHASTGANLGADTGMRAGTIPNHQKLMTALKLLATNGTLKRNNPGNPVWVGEHVTWFSFKPTLQAVRQHLIEEGHLGLPQSEHRLVQILNEHKHTILPLTGDDTWQGVITDTKRQGWTTKLSFFIVPNESIWAGGTPTLFDGTLVASDGKGKPLPEDKLPPQLKTSAGEQTTADEFTKSSAESAPVAVESEPTTTPAAETPKNAAKKPQPAKLKSPSTDDANANANEQGELLPKGKYSAGASELTINSHFFEWVTRTLYYRKLRYNEREAPVHVMDDYLILVTPAIFNAYLKHPDNKSELITLGKNASDRFKNLQKAVRLTNAHKRANDGGDFHKILVQGPKNNAEFNGMLVERSKLPQLKHLRSNGALSLA